MQVRLGRARTYRCPMCGWKVFRIDRGLYVCYVCNAVYHLRPDGTLGYPIYAGMGEEPKPAEKPVTEEDMFRIFLKTAGITDEMVKRLGGIERAKLVLWDIFQNWLQRVQRSAARNLAQAYALPVQRTSGEAQT